MPQVAVPSYVGKDFAQAPPGHRFGLYFPVWSDDGRWVRAGDNAKREALRTVLDLPSDSKAAIAALRSRQKALAHAARPERALTVHARSTAPFLTGIGMEHPLENGFAFLNPYGLPYLPGAGVKGVVRRAAEELALGFIEEAGGWDLLAVWWLFGFEMGSAYLAAADRKAPDTLRQAAEAWRAQYRRWISGGAWDPDLVGELIDAVIPKTESERWQRDPAAFLEALAGGSELDPKQIHFAGRLAFCDVLVDPAGSKLDTDVLTPHHTKYYQEGEPPHDSENPVPNPFLVVPPGSAFTFHVSRTGAYLPVSLDGRWKSLIGAAFEHAFDWLGFGAKTAVGYGAMAREGKVPAEDTARAAVPDESNRTAEEKELVAAEAARKAAAEAALTPEDRALRDLGARFENAGSADLQPGGPVASALNVVLQSAASWPADKTAQLADLAEAIWSRVGWGKAEKKAEKLARLARLRKG